MRNASLASHRYEVRPEFRQLQRGARRAGIPKSRVADYLPYRMLEVKVAANTVYGWAAEPGRAVRALDALLSAHPRVDGLLSRVTWL